MLNIIISAIRTAVPSVVGLVLSWLLAHDVITSAVADQADSWGLALAGALVLLVTSAWYSLVRLVEAKLPKLLAAFLPTEISAAVTRWVLIGLIGVPIQPTYSAPPAR